MTISKPGMTTYETPSDHEIRITRVLAAPRPLVYRAFTDPKHIPRWLTGPAGWTMPICEVDLRPGGAWRYVYEKEGGGAGMTLSGIFKEIVPNEKVVSTESWGPDWPETLNTMQLREQGTMTVMTLTIAYVSKEARDAALQSGMKEGVDAGFDRLDTILQDLA